MEPSKVVQVLAALAQETRLDAFRALVRAAPVGMAAGDIARELAIPPPTLSFHLKALLHAGLVQSRRSGRSLLYSANFEVLEEMQRFLTENCCAGSIARTGTHCGSDIGPEVDLEETPS